MTFSNNLRIFNLIINELIQEIMKKLKVLSGAFTAVLILFFLMASLEVAGQQTAKPSPAMPDDLNKIFTHSCTPCHTTKGPKMAQFMVNFDDWTKNTPEKQASKAEKIYSMVKSGKMPKKSEVEKRPDIVLTEAQIGLIKQWAESLKPPKK